MESGATGPLGRKPRVVFLHGTACNESIFRIQLAPLLRILKDVADVHFIVGQLACSEDDPKLAEDVRFMKKWFGAKQELRTFARYGEDAHGRRTYEAIDETLEAIEQQMRALPGKVDALVGFSQGTNLATMLDARAALRASGAPPPFRYAAQNYSSCWPDADGWWRHVGRWREGTLCVWRVLGGRDDAWAGGVRVEGSRWLASGDGMTSRWVPTHRRRPATAASCYSPAAPLDGPRRSRSSLRRPRPRLR